MEAAICGSSAKTNLVSLFRVIRLSHCHFRGVCILPGGQIPDGGKHSQFHRNYKQSPFLDYKPPLQHAAAGTAGCHHRGIRRAIATPGRRPSVGWARREPERVVLMVVDVFGVAASIPGRGIREEGVARGGVGVVGVVRPARSKWLRGPAAEAASGKNLSAKTCALPPSLPATLFLPTPRYLP